MSAARAAFSAASAVAELAFSLANAEADAESEAVLSVARPVFSAAVAATAAAKAASLVDLSAARAAFSAANNASAAAFSAVRAAFSAASDACAALNVASASMTVMNFEILFTATGRPITSVAAIVIHRALCPGVVGKVRVNSDTPSAFDDDGDVEVKLISDKVGETPVIRFPKTSEMVTLCFEIVEV